MSRSNVLTLLILCAGLISPPVPADGPPSFQPRSTGAETEYQRMAVDAYDMGYAFIERATRFDHDAAAADDERARREAMRGATQAYEDALRAFEQAVRAEPGMYEAHTYIGYASRKLGRYDRALSAYEIALQLKPTYARAIEYEGEAYLGLNRFDDAKFNYLRLYALDTEQAEKLLGAMGLWVEERGDEPRGVSAEVRNAASAWIASRPEGAVAARADEAAPW